MNIRCITGDSGTKYWYYDLNGGIIYHREDGPAIEYSEHHRRKIYKVLCDWYLNGRFVLPVDMPLNVYIAYCKWSLTNPHVIKDGWYLEYDQDTQDAYCS